MRPLAPVLVLLVAVAGCDTGSAGVVALDDVLVVDLDAPGPAAPPVLTFVTEGTPGCATPVAYRAHVSRDVLTVEVEGLEEPTGPTCRALLPSSFRVAVPQSGASGVDLNVRHRGTADRYEIRFDADADALVLAPVRTSVTRPGPR